MGVGKLLVGVGLLIVAIGVVLWWFPRAFAWFGNLPGDIRIEREGTRIFIPITSMVIVSVVLTIVLNALARWFGGGT